MIVTMEMIANLAGVSVPKFRQWRCHICGYDIFTVANLDLEVCKHCEDGTMERVDPKEED